MNKNAQAGLLVLILGLGGLFGGLYLISSSKREVGKIQPMTFEKGEGQAEQVASSTSGSESQSQIQRELDDVASKIVADMRAESRLNLNMLGQLRAYRSMVSQLDTIAQEVDHNMGIIEEINSEEFQHNTRLQATLFSGKKPDLVAKHLEEFPASRVGAILANMKPKEASTVLDIWASRKDPRTSAFYREVTSAYLNNKRYQSEPELFRSARGKEEKPEAAQPV